jgi:hypothetical protein
MKSYASSQRTPVKFERINNTERQQIAVKAADVRGLRDQRGQWEAPKPAAQHAPAVPRAPEIKTAKSPAAPAPARPSTKNRSPAFVPARPVHATEPEKVTVPSLPRTPQPTESRFIPKQPPSHPVQEQSHRAAPKPEKDHDSQPGKK